MSYILDALRKAEADRSRGAVPGVHAQQGPDVASDSRSADNRVKVLGWTVAALALILAATIGWRLSERPADPGPMASASGGPSRSDAPRVADGTGSTTSPTSPSLQTSPMPAAPLPQPSSVNASSALNTPNAGNAAPNDSSSAAGPALIEQPRSMPLQELRPPRSGVTEATRAPAPIPTPAQEQAQGQSPQPSTASPSNGAQRGGQSPAQTQTPANSSRSGQTQAQAQSTSPAQLQQPQQPPQAQAPRVYSLSELPDDVRTSLPAYAVNGASYSENPGARLLILNGQIAREGDLLPGGAVLEQIKLRGAVLRYRNYRYELPY